MKFWSDFRTDWRRVSNMVREGVFGKFQMILFPPFIAFILFKMFIDRGYPQDAFGQFVFFSTIYLFWVGISQTWQAVNGAVESGEWNYWILGIRRERRSYLRALFAYYIVRTLWVALLFVFSVAVFYVLCPWGWAYALVSPYCEVESALGRIIHSEVVVKAFGCGEGTELLPGMRLNVTFMLWWFVSFGVGLWMAAISGVCIGLSCSTVTRKPRKSVFLAVFILMVVMANSFVSLRATRSGNFDKPWREAFETGVPTYLPVYFAWQDRLHDRLAGYRQWRCGTSGANWSEQTVPSPSAKWCERMSFLSPQRYFFNIAHLCVPRLGYLSRGERENLDNLQRINECTRREFRHPKNCGCVFCLGIVPLKPFLRIRNAQSADGGRVDYYTDWLSPAASDDVEESDENGNKGELIVNEDVNVLRGIWLKTALFEIGTWMVLCAAIIFLFVMLPIRFRSYLNTLR